MKRLLCLLLVFAFVLGGCAEAPGSAPPPESSPPDPELPLTPVLNGRLYVHLPEGMDTYDDDYPDVNPHATAFDFEEIEWMYPLGKPNLYFAELYALSTGDIKRDAELLNQKRLLFYQYECIYDTEPIICENGIEMLVGVPDETSRHFDAYKTLQKFILIKMPDNTLIALMVSVSDHKAVPEEKSLEELKKEKDALELLLEGVLSSITPGERSLVLDSRPITLRDYPSIYEAVCPANYFVTHFSYEWENIYTFTKVDTIDKNQVYTYLHLATQAFRYTPPENYVETLESELFGYPITWTIAVQDDGSYYASTYIERVHPDRWVENYCVEIYYTDPADWDTMREMLERTQLKEE